MRSGVTLWRRLAGEFPDHTVPFLPVEPPGGETRHLALVLAYRGAGLAGWQVQPQDKTVQGELEKALSRLLNQPVRLAASGRTDAGVHAWGQVAGFQTTGRLGLPELARGLSALLPPEIALRQVGPVDESFHPRYSVQEKTYCYYLLPAARPNPFLNGFLWPVRRRLNPEPVAETLALLPGERDMAALSSGPVEVMGSTVRAIHRAELFIEPGGLWRVTITASGFLRHVVRNLVGVLYQIGSGRLAPDALFAMLAAGKRLYSGPKAPPEGLYLAQVVYNSPNNLAEGSGK